MTYPTLQLKLHTLLTTNAPSYTALLPGQKPQYQIRRGQELQNRTVIAIYWKVFTSTSPSPRMQMALVTCLTTPLVCFQSSEINLNMKYEYVLRIRKSQRPKRIPVAYNLQMI